MSIVRWVPLALALVAEGAWTWVLAGFVDELSLRPPVVGLPVFVLAVLLGVLVARLASPRLVEAGLGRLWPWLALAMTVVAAGAGILGSAAARDAIATGGPAGIGQAFGLNAGGALVGLAVLRGFGHAHLPLSEDRLGRLLFGGLVVIAFLSLIGALIGEPYRSVFLADALTGALLFSANALLALALTRLTVVAGGAGVDWASNPSWLALLLGLVAGVEVLAAPAAGLIGSAFVVAFWIAVGPVLILGLLLGWTRNTLRAVSIILLLLIAFVVLLPFLSGPLANTIRGQNGGPGVGNPATSVDPGVATVGLGLATLLGIAILVLLIRSWMRRVTAGRDDLLDTRTIDRGGDRLDHRRRPRLPFRTGPHDAVAAYRRLLEELSGRPTVARLEGETPHEHARRLRGDGWGRLGLELLAADYELARFASEPLTPAEHRRAVSRWRRLRADLRPAPILKPERRPAPGGGRFPRPLDDDVDLDELDEDDAGESER